MADIFISYASEDRERVAPIAAALEHHGFTVWWDAHLRAGETFDEVIEREILAASAVIVVWSDLSVSRRWVRSEASDALERNILVPIKVDSVRLPIAFRLVQAENFVGWTGATSAACWQRLILQIDALVARAKGRSADPAPDVAEIAETITEPLSHNVTTPVDTTTKRQRGPWGAVLQFLFAGVLSVSVFYGIYFGLGILSGSSALLDGLGSEPAATLAIPVAAAIFFFALFAIAEREISPQNKSLATRWLLPVDGGVKVSAAEAFNSLFETTFGRNHLSFNCFWRSVAASMFCLTIAGVIGAPMANDFDINFGNYTYYLFPLFFYLAIPNVLADYVSLFQTRVFIRWLKKWPILALPLVLVDAVLTVVIYLLVVFAYWLATGNMSSTGISEGYVDGPVGGMVMSAGVATTYITSIWLWLVFLFGPVARMLLWNSKRGATPVGRFLTVQKNPFRSLGFVIGFLIMMIGPIAFAYLIFDGCAFGC